MKYKIIEIDPEKIRLLYESFLSDKEISGLTSSPANYKNAYNRPEMKQALLNVCGKECLYEVVDITTIEEVKNELVRLRKVYKDDATKVKRCRDCNSYLNKYILFLNNCEIKPQTPPEESGCVYILTNDIFKKPYIKIGCTGRSVQERVDELSRTALPHPYTIYATLRTSKYRQAEKMMHKMFDNDRVKYNREFFYLKPEEALEQLTTIAEGLEGEIDIYKSDKVEKTISFKK